jgi:hypothetical protein
MLTPTNVINYIENRLGFQFTDIELSHEEIIENIRRYTLPVFSKYFPNQERIIIDSTRDKVPDTVNIYYIKCETEILNINRIIGLGTVGSDAVAAFVHPAAMAQMMSDPISMQMAADMLSLCKNPVTFIYHHPNKVEISPNYALNNNYVVVCNTVHAPHFGTIPTLLENDFLQFAYADTAINIYNIRKRFSNMQTSFGSMELNLDDLSEAKDLRNELIEQFSNSALKSGKRKKVIIA